MKRKRKTKNTETLSESHLANILSLCDGYQEGLDDSHKDTFNNIEKDGKTVYPFIYFITRDIHGFKESCVFLIPKNQTISVVNGRKQLKFIS